MEKLIVPLIALILLIQVPAKADTPDIQIIQETHLVTAKVPFESLSFWMDLIGSEIWPKLYLLRVQPTGEVDEDKATVVFVLSTEHGDHEHKEGYKHGSR